MVAEFKFLDTNPVEGGVLEDLGVRLGFFVAQVPTVEV